MPRGRVKLPVGLEHLLASDWERVLTESMLGREDREIARLYIVERLPQADIAGELHFDRSTVSRRMERILNEARRVAVKLDYL